MSALPTVVECGTRGRADFAHTVNATRCRAGVERYPIGTADGAHCTLPSGGLVSAP